MLFSTFIFFLTTCAFAQQDILQVIRVDEVLPLLGSLLNSGTSRLEGAAGHIAEFLPVGNLKGAMSGAGNLVEAIQAPLSAGGGGSLLSVGRQIPVIGALLPSLSAFGQIKTNPELPTLAPAPVPQEASRVAADLGVKSTAVKDTFAVVASIPVHALAAGTNTLATAIEGKSNSILGTPNQINQLLQFQHSLFGSYLAGMNAAMTAVPPQTLRDELRGLSSIQPHLTGLMDQFDNPEASGALDALNKAFESLKAPERSEDVAEAAEASLFGPIPMKIAFANIAMNFLQSVLGGAAERMASDL